jgi:putative DNA primase/helicase
METLLRAFRSYDIEIPKHNIDNGRMHRWGRNNRYWVRRFDGGYVFGDFVIDLSTHVFDKNEREYSKAELRLLRANMEKARKEAEIEQDKIHETASVKANGIWSNAKSLISHGYLAEKHVSSHGLREHDGRITIPLYDENGKIWTLQYICENPLYDENRKNDQPKWHKRFLSDGKKKGCYYVIGDIEKSEQVFICEGYATGATVHECTGEAVVIAFCTAGLKPVAQIIRRKYPHAKIVICADNDQFHDNGANPGVEKAIEAAKEVNALVVKPEFDDLSDKPTDFNDLFVLAFKKKQSIADGTDAVKTALQNTVNLDKPLGFSVSDNGLFFINNKNEIQRISNYIKVLAFVKNKGKTSKLVEFKDHKNRLLTTVLHSQMFSKGGDQVRIHLSDLGFVYSWNYQAKNKLVEYLSDSIPEKETVVANTTGFYGKAYLRPDIVIGEACEEIMIDNSADQGYGVRGSLQEWQRNVSMYCVNNSRLTFVVSVAFASIILKICGVPNCGFHLVGNSSSGKTTCLKVAASVFGNPSYVLSWNTTDNRLESTAFKRNEALLILDELSEMSPAHKAGELAYKLANGSGRARLDKDCSDREILKWRLLFLSSGEIDLSTHLEESHKISKAGQDIRFINIQAEPDVDSFGIFESLHNFVDGSELANHLIENAATYYGSASVEFIKLILKDMNSIKNQYKEDAQLMKSEHLPQNAKGQDMRVFERFMFVGFAGELATKYGVTGWNIGDAYEAALKCFHSWLEDKGGAGNQEDKKIMEHVRSFFELHGCSRFYDLNGLKGQKVTNMAGYKETYHDETTFYVSPSVFKSEVCKGFNRKSVINLLIKNGLLLLNNSGEYRQQKWTHDGNKKVYVVSGKILA